MPEKDLVIFEEYLLPKASLEKLLIRTQPTNLLEIYFEFIIYSKVIIKSVINADNNFQIEVQAILG